jgi:hypothetical protein
MNPPKSILDPTFVYVPAVDTDIRKLFARVRAERRVVESIIARKTPGSWIVLNVVESTSL